ncbi:MAG: Ferredoxin, 2Fe-2S [uncultured Rubrobacteraceae bacterium]|uniref:Ferredoxin, 2Fe-2S n=1 Tax=uncultured Rubrobacteraceae bacterium TaxID=349277 RepID=A0A6J4Q528_9ACTN|nr:MAG: Ferredoxin, 2Fe-2S [uncultured Rubrobacteraceae bacterium]
MSSTLSQRIVERLPWLDGIAEKLQPKVQEVIDKGGTTLRNALDGVWLEAPLHPVLQTVPVGSWTAAITLDAVDIMSGSKATRNAADGTLAVGVVSGFAVAAVGLSDWRYLSGGSRRMGMAHGLLNTAGLALNTASLVLRATGRRNAGRAAFLAGYTLNGIGAHLGGELSYHYGLRVNRNVFEWGGPDEYTAVLEESELSGSELRRVELDSEDGGKVGILLSRTQGGKVCAISATCNHFSGPLERGDREGDTVVCPWHKSRFDLCSGESIDGPAVFPQSRYHTRVRDGNIEIKAAAENVQKKVR